MQLQNYWGSGDTPEKDEVIIKIGHTGIKNSEYEKLLGIKVDTKLNFNDHSNDMIIKARCKVNALSRIMPYVNSYKKKKLRNSFSSHNLVTAPSFTCYIAVL